jgi:hypothetical protein
MSNESELKSKPRKGHSPFVEPDGDIFFDAFIRPAIRHTHGYNGFAQVEIQYNGSGGYNKSDTIMAEVEFPIPDMEEVIPLPFT